MVQMNVTYQGEKHCELTHGPSGVKISTDAPRDNMGLGQAFSPTDLLSVSLASCILTTMAIIFEKDGIDLKGAWSSVGKEMTGAPRRVGKISLEIHLPKKLTAEQRQKLEPIAEECPVHRSLHPDLIKNVHFIYDVI